MKITIIFPGREVEQSSFKALAMPLAPTLLAALTPRDHDVTLVDALYGDPIDATVDAASSSGPSARSCTGARSMWP